MKKQSKKKAEQKAEKLAPASHEKASDGYKFIPGFERLYEQNKDGVIQSLPKVNHHNIIKLSPNRVGNGRPYVDLHKAGERTRHFVHKLLEKSWGIVEEPKTKKVKKEKVVKEKKAKVPKATKIPKQNVEKKTKAPATTTTKIQKMKGDEVVETFDSIISAARSVGVDASTLSKAIKSGNQCKEFTWKKVVA